MPSDVSFLSASRSSGRPVTDIGGSKIKGLNAQALSQPYNAWESYIPTPSINNSNTETLQIPFGAVNSNNHVFKVKLNSSLGVPSWDESRVLEMLEFRQVLTQKPNEFQEPTNNETRTRGGFEYPGDSLIFANQGSFLTLKPQNSAYPTISHRNGFSFALQNDDDSYITNNDPMDNHTVQYSGNTDFKLAEFNNALIDAKFLDDVVWEFSIFARALRPEVLLSHERGITDDFLNHEDVDYRISTVNGPLGSGDFKRMHFQHQFDHPGMHFNKQRSRTAEIMIFGVDDNANASFDGYNVVTIDPLTTTGEGLPHPNDVHGHVITHPKTGGTAYSLKREVVGGEWQLLRMYVKFTNPKITGITVRIGNRDVKRSRIVFAHPRLSPHNLSLQKVLGGLNFSAPYIPTPTDFSFGDELG